ncbi:12106_t:CDS:10, partial [Racocetra fulgida]
ESDYETAAEGDKSDSESDNESKPEEKNKIIFRRIEDPAPKRLVETRRISDQGLCIDLLANISENYSYREDPLATFKDFVTVGRFHNHRLDQDIAFPSEILDIIRQDRIDQTVSQQYHEILDKIDEMKHNQYSDWTYKYSKKIFLEISAYQPLQGYLASEEARRQETRARNLHDVSRLRRFDNVLDFTGIDFPATLRDIDKFEENNPSYSINVFYPALSKNEKEQATRKLDPLRISEYNYQREHMVDLILFTEGEEDLRDHCNINEIPPGLNMHYCLINDKSGWSRIMSSWNKHKERKYFCRHWMIAPFSRKDLLEEHKKHNCHGQNNLNAGQREIFPEKGKHIMKFKNYKAMENVPFYFVKDLEADSDLIEDNIINKKTVKLQKQKPNSYNLEEIIKPKLRNPEKIKMTERNWQTHNSAIKCYICKGMLHETRYNKVKYFDSTKKFIAGAHHGCVKIKCEATEENLMEALYHTKGLTIEEENIFKKATECCLCKMKLRADINDNRVRDHDHFTGKYRGPAHHGCNFQLRIKPDEIKIPLIYHGRKHYDFHHEIRELGLVSDDKIKIIADNMENYKTIIIGQIKFIDSCQFQFPSLEKVATNLRGKEKTPEQLAKWAGEYTRIRTMLDANTWEVKLRYPENLHPSHSDYPLCPEHRVVKRNELIRPIGEEHRLRKMLADPALVGRKIFHESNLIAVYQKQTNIIQPDGSRELKNKKIIGKWKNEFAGTRALRYAGNRSKSYALETEDGYKNVQKAKGLKKSLVKKELTIDIYEHCILEVSDITWKRIEEAQLKIIREALRICYKKDSKLVTEYASYYQGKKELLASLENLYSLYYTLSKEERFMIEEEISKTIEELIADVAVNGCIAIQIGANRINEALN